MRLAVFDVDHTITRASTGRRLLEYGYRAGWFSLPLLLSVPYHYLMYRLGRFRPDGVAAKIVTFAGRSRSELEAVAKRCMDEAVKNDIMPGAVEIIEKCRKRGDTVVFATSSLGLIIHPLALHMGIDNVLCTELEYEDGVATGRFARNPCFSEQKLFRVQEFANGRGLGLTDVTFYSDSRLDLPLLRAAGEAVAVNPDPGLRRHATLEGWQILKIR